jgi:uncharacterized membrane protein
MVFVSLAWVLRRVQWTDALFSFRKDTGYMLKFQCRFVIVALVAIGTSNTFAGTQYSIIDLGNISSPLDINDHGQVLFGEEWRSEDGTRCEKGWLWENESFSPLDRIYTGLNNSGQMMSYQYFRDHDGTVINVSGDSVYTIISDLNDVGQYVGVSQSANDSLYPGRATIWDHNAGTQKQMGTPAAMGDRGSYATAVNNIGQVAGFFNDEIGYEAFLWDSRNDTEISLGNGVEVTMDINENGQILCGYKDESGNFYRGIWDHGNVTNIGEWHADSINNSGHVVGEKIWAESTQGPSPLLFNALLWEDGILYDLDDLIPADSGWDLTTAVKINNRDQIIGVGVFNNEGHAYLLTPIPEPGTLAMLLLGGVAVLRRKGNKKRIK